jgi:ATP phosphoribosyltransferase regulatory subunit
LLCDALDATGLKDYRVGLGDASLFTTLMDRLQIDLDVRAGLLETLASRDFVELGQRLEAIGLSEESAALLLSLPQRRGGAEVLEAPPGPAADAIAGMREVSELLDTRVAERVIFDLGLVRSIGYYTGAVFEVYDPALGAPIGGGGRYDDLLGHFGVSRPAVGFAFDVERLHIALTGEERGTGVALG